MKYKLLLNKERACPSSCTRPVDMALLSAEALAVPRLGRVGWGGLYGWRSVFECAWRSLGAIQTANP